MSTNPKPQRQPKETLTVAHRTSSSRAAARSWVEYTCCRAGAPGWVCARRGRLPNGPSPEVDASPYQRRVTNRAVPGDNPGTPGPCMGTRAAGGQGGSCLLAGLALPGAQMTPGVGPATWVRSSIP
nr:protein F [Hepacivirus hominis]